ncbi:MAG TPA: hypothetical protein VMR08_02270 [Patescibacteria group bacterium]|nr:hypothetical protein [Patescibacteria group bacterium]
MARKRTKPSWRKLRQEASNAKDLNDLSTDGLILFNFITQIVDIKYRNKYGRPLELTDSKGYSVAMQDEVYDE